MEAYSISIRGRKWRAVPPRKGNPVQLRTGLGGSLAILPSPSTESAPSRTLQPPSTALRGYRFFFTDSTGVRYPSDSSRELPPQV
jgi:hypothetical protein